MSDKNKFILIKYFLLGNGRNFLMFSGLAPYQKFAILDKNMQDMIRSLILSKNKN